MLRYLNQESLEKLKKELNYLKTVKRREVAKQLGQAAGFGDITENAAYQEARESKEFLERRILELEKKIEEAVIVKKPQKSNQVQLGSTVLVESPQKRIEFKIVDPEEADPLQGKISYDSPLGKNLLNKTKGSVVEVKTPGGKVKYKIIQIR
jgi:transcription elongation factor GreA